MADLSVVIAGQANQALAAVQALRLNLAQAAQQGTLTAASYHSLSQQIAQASAQHRQWSQVLQQNQAQTQGFAGQLSGGLVNALGSTTGGVGRLVSSFAGMAAGAAVGVGAVMALVKVLELGAEVVGKLAEGFMTAAKVATEFNSAQSTARMGLESLLGSGEAANEMMLRIRESQGALVMGPANMGAWAQQMINAGADANTVLPMIDNLLGTMAKGSKLTEANADLAVKALAQMSAKGKVTFEEVNQQLVEQGVPAWKLLADHMGIAQSAVMELASKGLIPATTLMEALTKSGNVSQLEKSVKTLSGAWMVLSSRVQMVLGDLESPVYKRFESIISGIAKVMMDPRIPQGIATVSAIIESMIAPLDGIGGLIKGVEGFTVNWGETLKGAAKLGVVLFGTFELGFRIIGGMIKGIAAAGMLLFGSFIVQANQMVNAITTGFKAAMALKDGNQDLAGAILAEGDANAARLATTWHNAAVQLAKDQIDAAGIIKDAYGDTQKHIAEGFKIIDNPPTPKRGDLPGAPKPPPSWTAAQAKDLKELEDKLAEFEKDQRDIWAKSNKEIEEINKDLNKKLFGIWEAREERNKDLRETAARAEADYARKVQDVHSDLAAFEAEKARDTAQKLGDALRNEEDAQADSARKRQRIDSDLAEARRTIAEEMARDIAAIEKDAQDQRGEIDRAFGDRQRQNQFDFVSIQAEGYNRVLALTTDFAAKYEDQRVAAHQRTLDALASLEVSQARKREDAEYDAVERRARTVEDLDLELRSKQRRGELNPEEAAKLAKERAFRLADLADQEKVNQDRLAREQAHEAAITEQRAKEDEARNLAEIERQQAKDQVKLDAAIAVEQDLTRQKLAELMIREIAARAKDDADLIAIEAKRTADIEAVTKAADEDRRQAEDRATKAIAELNRVDLERQTKYDLQIQRITDEAAHDVQKAQDAARDRLIEMARVELQRQTDFGQALLDSDARAVKERQEAIDTARERIAQAQETARAQIAASNEARIKFLEDKGEEIKALRAAKVAAEEYQAALHAAFLEKAPPALAGAGAQAIAGGDALRAMFPGEHRAAGGPVTGGKTYLVGESGPELFTASSSGFISPNSGGPGQISGGGESAQADLRARYERERRAIEIVAEQRGRQLDSERAAIKGLEMAFTSMAATIKAQAAAAMGEWATKQLGGDADTKRKAEAGAAAGARNDYENQIALARSTGDSGRAAQLLEEYLPKLKEWTMAGGPLDPAAQKPHYAAPETGLPRATPAPYSTLPWGPGGGPAANTPTWGPGGGPGSAGGGVIDYDKLAAVLKEALQGVEVAAYFDGNKVTEALRDPNTQLARRVTNLTRGRF